MCGFVGFTGMRAEREAILHRMADRIIHRGPDMEGYHLSGDTPENAVALGFRRLSIIDLAAGKQPICVEACPLRALDFGDIEELRAAYGDDAEIAPLPAADETKPNLVITAPAGAKPVGDSAGEIMNELEIM